MRRFILFRELLELSEQYGEPVEIRCHPEQQEVAFVFETGEEEIVALLEEVY